MAEALGAEGTPGEIALGVLALLASGGAEEHLDLRDVGDRDRARLASSLARAKPPPVHALAAIASACPCSSLIGCALAVLAEAIHSVDSLNSLGTTMSSSVGSIAERSSPLGRLLRRPALTLTSLDPTGCGRLLDRISTELSAIVDLPNGAPPLDQEGIALDEHIDRASSMLSSGEWRSHLAKSLSIARGRSANELSQADVDTTCNESGPRRLSDWLAEQSTMIAQGRDFPGERAQVEALASTAPTRSHANPQLVHRAVAAAATSSRDATASIDSIHQHHDASAESVEAAGVAWRPYGAMLQRAELHATLEQPDDAQMYANEALKGTLQSPDELEHLHCLASICSSGLKAGKAPQQQPFNSLLSYLARRSAEQDLPHLVAYAHACSSLLESMRGTLLLSSGQPSLFSSQHSLASMLPRALSLLHATQIRMNVPLAPPNSEAIELLDSSASNAQGALQQQHVRGTIGELCRDVLALPAGHSHPSAHSLASASAADSTASSTMIRAAYASLDAAEPLALANLLSLRQLRSNDSEDGKESSNFQTHRPVCSWWLEFEGELAMAAWKFASQGPRQAQSAAASALSQRKRPFLCPKTLATRALINSDAVLRRCGYGSTSKLSACECALHTASSLSDVDPRSPKSASRLAAAHVQLGNASEALAWHWASVDKAGNEWRALDAVEALDMLSMSETSMRPGPHGVLNALAARSFARAARLAATESACAVTAAEALLAWTPQSSTLAKALLHLHLQTIEAHCDICTAGRARLTLAKCYLHDAPNEGRKCKQRQRARHELERGTPLLEQADHARCAEEAYYLRARIAHSEGDISSRNALASRWRSWAKHRQCCDADEEGG